MSFLKLIFLSAVLFFASCIGCIAAKPSLEQVTLGGIKQWIYTTGDNDNNPVLLVLHGGPGFAMLPLFHDHNQALEKKLTIVNWDQRGAGKSYSNHIPPETMTLDQLVSDAHELTLQLKKRYGKKKIYLLGHSSGTMIGILLVKRYPEDYEAYVGVGQVISFAENEQASYDFALKNARLTHNEQAIQQLTQIGRPDAEGNYKTEKGYDITDKWVEFFGGDLHNRTNLDELYKELFDSDVYQHDAKKLKSGYEFSQLLFDDPKMRTFNIQNVGMSFPIPVYFVSGKYDYDTSIDLVKKYYPLVQAPHKELIEFNQSAHFPFYEQPKQFNQIILERVLPTR